MASDKGPIRRSMLGNIKYHSRYDLFLPFVCRVNNNVLSLLKEGEDQIEAVIKANLIPALLGILENDKYEGAKESVWAIYNAIDCGSDEQVLYLIKQGFLR